tara:strand:+ start:50 stop:286 length:237 start_codon:yes stop_codon:yes gene_type:complete
MDKFIVIERKHWDFIDFDECREPGMHSCKRNGLRCVVSFNGDHPSFCYNITNDDVGLDEYTPGEIYEFITSNKWNLQN